MRTPLYDKPIIGFFNNVAAHLCSLLLRGLGDEPFNLGFGDRTALRTFTLLILPSDRSRSRDRIEIRRGSAVSFLVRNSFVMWKTPSIVGKHNRRPTKEV
jgi:hypothetical protein